MLVQRDTVDSDQTEEKVKRGIHSKDFTRCNPDAEKMNIDREVVVGRLFSVFSEFLPGDKDKWQPWVGVCGCCVTKEKKVSIRWNLYLILCLEIASVSVRVQSNIIVIKWCAVQERANNTHVVCHLWQTRSWQLVETFLKQNLASNDDQSHPIFMMFSPTSVLSWKTFLRCLYFYWSIYILCCFLP